MHRTNVGKYRFGTAGASAGATDRSDAPNYNLSKNGYSPLEPTDRVHRSWGSQARTKDLSVSEIPQIFSEYTEQGVSVRRPPKLKEQMQQRPQKGKKNNRTYYFFLREDICRIRSAQVAQVVVRVIPRLVARVWMFT